ncbi:MAG: hypothetical protein HON90_17440, partial [Halobacteriovoraceae bacterium]|nr:hypothetical protein [Halobacteriovoraceae bacterium]
MKSLCSLYTFLFLLSAHATQIRIIHLSKNTQQAELVRSIFVKRYSVPKGLIEIRESAECRSLDQR